MCCCACMLATSVSLPPPLFATCRSLCIRVHVLAALSPLLLLASVRVCCRHAQPTCIPSSYQPMAGRGSGYQPMGHWSRSKPAALPPTKPPPPGKGSFSTVPPPSSTRVGQLASVDASNTSVYTPRRTWHIRLILATRPGTHISPPAWIRRGPPAPHTARACRCQVVVAACSPSRKSKGTYGLL